MTAEAQTGVSADPAELASWRLSEQQLGDLELLLSGAFAPLTGFMSDLDVRTVAGTGMLADGTPWPIPVTLEVPEDAVPADAEHLELLDPEGTPLAVLEIAERSLVPAAGQSRDTRPWNAPRTSQTGASEPGASDADGRHAEGSEPGPGDADPRHAESSEPGRSEPGTPPRLIRLAGPVTGRRKAEHGPFRRLMLSPAETRTALGTGPVLAFATRGPLTGRQLGQLRHMTGQLRARVLLLPLIAGPADVITRPEALVRAVLAAVPSLPVGTMVVPVPLAARSAGTGSRTGDATRELAAVAIVAAAHGATHLMADSSPTRGVQLSFADGVPCAPIPVLPSGDWAYDARAEVWRPLSLIEAGLEQEDLSPSQLGDLLDAGADIPAWFTPPAVARELRRARPPRAERGFVLFLTGLSGSGKSTIARDLRDMLAERGDRRVSLLDGDLVRQLLSAGLTFSPADRDLNVARIGYVAAEIARHGGIAICAPIAPYAAARDRVRKMVTEVGDLLLIHVATPVEVCEARDRKGLYAKARAGLISQFTGVSDPYEEPADADLVIDTSAMTRKEAASAVLGLLTSGGWLSVDPG